MQILVLKFNYFKNNIIRAKQTPEAILFDSPRRFGFIQKMPCGYDLCSEPGINRITRLLPGQYAEF